MVDQHPLGFDALIVFENAGDDRRAFVLVFQVRRVDEDELVVSGGDVNLLFEDGDLNSSSLYCGHLGVVVRFAISLPAWVF